MALIAAPEAVSTQIWWGVILSMTITERQVNEGAAMFLTQRPVRGTVTLTNGWKREAHYLAGRRSVLQYKTPAGNWRNASKAEASTFTETA